MIFKMYRMAVDDSRLFRVHPNGKVETSTNTRSWFNVPSLTPATLNWMRREGIAIKLPNSDGTNWEELQAEHARLSQCLMYAEDYHLGQLVPVAPSGTSGYQRIMGQTRQGSLAEVRGYDEWSFQDGLETLNKGLSVPITTMIRRRHAIAHAIGLLDQLLARR